MACQISWRPVGTAVQFVFQKNLRFFVFLLNLILTTWIFSDKSVNAAVFCLVYEIVFTVHAKAKLGSSWIL
jgi:hypothetical protein